MGKWIYNDKGEKIAYDFGPNPKIRVVYGRGEISVGLMKKEAKKHKDALEQPYLPNGKINPRFVKLYGRDHPAYKK